MRHWIITIVDNRSKQEKQLTLLAPSSYNAQKIKQDLRAVHPEFKKIRCKRTRWPDHITLFRDDKKVKPKKKVKTSLPPKAPARKIGFG